MGSANRHSAGQSPIPHVVIAGMIMLVAAAGCYSFKGGTVPSHLKTVGIALTQDQSGYGDPRLRDTFNSLLVDRFLGDNSLTVTDVDGADSILESTIVSVTETAVVVAPGEEVRLRRMTVTIRASFRDQKLKKTMWEKTFSQYGDYESGGGPSLRDLGVQEAISKISEDILNETVAGW